MPSDHSDGWIAGPSLGRRFMSRQKDGEPSTFLYYFIDKEKSAALFDDAIHGRQAKPAALTDFLGREERLENLFDYNGRNAAAGISDVDPDLTPRPHTFLKQHFPPLPRYHFVSHRHP